MKKIVLCLGISAFAVFSVVGQVQFKRLDGSTIAQSEIDQTVARAMKGAEVPGVGLALLK